ncbi:hypothetical protein BV25DRAFT_1934938 [Artomyces pyxidatus]|uniref:Uncharacterized protein n=1 Tax=Artomyces pyxidatus TaxID=48021 RepID=A0ACB8T6Y3_9AGAM|nr:hypothetical protein BV25DRAFT_1934938 [Artomyces pyxidatus]
MKVLLTGATGAAGLPILRNLLGDPSVSAVTVLARRPLPAWVALPDTGAAHHPKLTTVPDTDFLHYSPQMQSTIAAHDACIWALGKSTAGLSEAVYTELTVGYLDAFLGAVKAGGAGSKENPFRLVFISGNGADSSESSRILFARVKGKAENNLLASAKASEGTLKATVMRPSYFFPAPADALHQRGRLMRIADKTLGALLRNVLPFAVISNDEIAEFAVRGAKGQWESRGEIFQNTEMKRLVKEAVKNATTGPRDEL